MSEGRRLGLIYGKITQVIFYCRIFSIFQILPLLGANIFLSILFSDISNYPIDVGITENKGASIFSYLIIKALVSWEVIVTGIFH